MFGFTRRSCLGCARAVRRSALFGLWVLVPAIGQVYAGFQDYPNLRVDDSAAGTFVLGSDLKADSTGVLHAVWAESPNQVRYARSTTGGTLWTSSVNITVSSTSVGAPSLAADDSTGVYDGYVYVAFSNLMLPDYRIDLVRSMDRGQSWEPVLHNVNQPNPADAITVLYPEVTVDNIGTVMIVWGVTMKTGKHGIYFSYSSDAGQTFATPVRLDSGLAKTSFPSIATLDASVFVSYKSDSGSYEVVSSQDRGLNWNTPVSAAACSSSSRSWSSIVCDSATGRVVVAFETEDGFVARVYSDNDGQSWSAPARIDDDSQDGWKASPPLTTDGTLIHAVWTDQRSGNSDIYYSASPDGGITWGDGLPDTDLRVDDTGVNADINDDDSVQDRPRGTTFQADFFALWLDRRANDGGYQVYTTGGPRPIITEFRDEPASNFLIELFNPTAYDFDMAQFYLELDAPPLIALNGLLPAGGSFTIGASSATPAPDFSILSTVGPDAGRLKLLDSREFTIDSVDYGTRGTTPDPAPGTSAARYYDAAGAVFVNQWTYQDPPTFGQENTCGYVDSKPDVILNEVLFNPVNPQIRFIEIVCIVDNDVDLTGYRIVADGIHIIGAQSVGPGDPIYYVSEWDDPGLFADLDTFSDNVYLFDDAGNLLDMVGWTSGHAPGTSVARVPSGAGSYDGHDDASSEAAGWKFDQAPTIPVVYIWDSQTRYGVLGDTFVFPLTIKNNQNVSDIVDIALLPRIGTGWNAGVYDALGVTPIPDANNPDGRPDVLIGPDSTLNLTVKVEMPALATPEGQEVYDVVVESASNPVYTGAVVLAANLYPYLWVDKTIAPDTINIEGTGYDEEATITLSVTGAGYPVEIPTLLDVVFMIDTSGSMADTSIAIAKDAMKNFVDDMEAEDRGAVVEFESSAWLVDNQHLTSIKALLKSTVDNVGGSGGGTDIAAAIREANTELLNYGDASRVRAEILLTDGQSDEASALAAAQEATDNGMIIYTVGLGGGVNVNLLQQIADMTGGEYFFANTPSDLDGIYEEISNILSIMTAAKDIDPTDPNPMIRDVLPPYINYVADSAFDPDTGNPLPPDSIYTDGNGRTFLEWNVPLIRIGRSWDVAFNVTSTQPGLQLSNVVLLSRADYVDWEEIPQSQLFPEAWVTVVEPPNPCPSGPPGRIPDLKMVRSGRDVAFYWTPDPLAGGGYNIYHDGIKMNLPDLRLPTFVPAAALVGMPHTIVDAVDNGLLYYQVTGVCQDQSTEGPN